MENYLQEIQAKSEDEIARQMAGTCSGQHNLIEIRVSSPVTVASPEEKTFAFSSATDGFGGVPFIVMGVGECARAQGLSTAPNRGPVPLSMTYLGGKLFLRFQTVYSAHTWMPLHNCSHWEVRLFNRFGQKMATYSLGQLAGIRMSARYFDWPATDTPNRLTYHDNFSPADLWTYVSRAELFVTSHPWQNT